MPSRGADHRQPLKAWSPSAGKDVAVPNPYPRKSKRDPRTLKQRDPAQPLRRQPSKRSPTRARLSPFRQNATVLSSLKWNKPCARSGEGQSRRPVRSPLGVSGDVNSQLFTGSLLGRAASFAHR